jgi:hypothetical protein
MPSADVRRLWQGLPADFAELLHSALLDMDAIEAAVIAEVDTNTRAEGRELDEPTEANLRLGVRTAVQRFLEELGPGGAPPQRGLFIAHGRAQHDAGRSLEELLSFYHLGALVLLRRAAAGGPGPALNAQQLGALASAIFAFIHDLSAAGIEGYSQARSELAGTREARRERLFGLLMADPPAPPERVEAAAQLARWRLPDLLVAVAIDADHAERVRLAVGASTLTGLVDEAACALLTADASLDWQVSRVLDSLPAGTTAGLGEIVGWHDARVSFRYALAARTLSADGSGPLVRAQDMPVWLLLASDPHLAERIRETHLEPLEGLAAATRERLTTTLRAWLDSPDQPQAIANRLGVHVQTVRYRMRQLRELFGAALDDPARRFELAVALHVTKDSIGADKHS